MTIGIEVTGFEYTERFKEELLGAPADVRKAVRDALELLLRNPRAKTLRLHNLTGFPKPTIWKIDVFANHSWQITFELRGGIADLKRLASHKVIDRQPR